MKKILIVTQHFAPYRDDSFKELMRLGEYQIRFLITDGNVTHMEWEYENNDFLFQQSNTGKKIKGLGIIYDKYIELLQEYNPEVVITSGNLALLMYTKLLYRMTKVIFVSDQIKVGKNYNNIFVRILLKSLYNLADGIWTTGKAGEQYFELFIKDSSKIRQGCYTNSIDRIQDNANSYKKEEVRKEFGIGRQDYVFLFVGKMIATRRIDRIVEIAQCFENTNQQVKFLLVGNGPDSYLVEKCECKNIVYIPSIPIAQLEKVYVASDAYLYLGWEPYSLALYEAAILGLPIIASKDIGAMYDCVIDNSNGYGIEEYDKNLIINKMTETISGAYNAGAESMRTFIANERGTKWSAQQLQELIER